jgi:hypothetical protein
MVYSQLCSEADDVVILGSQENAPQARTDEGALLHDSSRKPLTRIHGSTCCALFAALSCYDHLYAGFSLHPAGSASAMQLLQRAEWSGLDLSKPVTKALFDTETAASSLITDHINEDLIHLFDVMVIEKLYPDPESGSSIRPISRTKTKAVMLQREAEGKTVNKKVNEMTTKEYSMNLLIKTHRFQRINRPTILLHSSGRTPRIMALFLNESIGDINLKQLVDGHEKLHNTAKEYFQNCADRPKILMGGLQYNLNAHMSKTAGMRAPRAAGYYTAKGGLGKGRILSDPIPEPHQVIRRSAAMQCEVERKIAPRLSLLRSLAMHPHPGLLPGIPRDEVPASSMGVSKGYASPIHNDVGYGGLTETISWNTESVPRNSGLGFAIWSCQVVFDLCASSSNFVMVPSGLFHGTCPTEVKHGAIGFATITSGRLDGRHFDEFEALVAKINDPRYTGYLEEGFLFTSHSPFTAAQVEGLSLALRFVPSRSSRRGRRRGRGRGSTRRRGSSHRRGGKGRL